LDYRAHILSNIHFYFKCIVIHMVAYFFYTTSISYTSCLHKNKHTMWFIFRKFFQKNKAVSRVFILKSSKKIFDNFLPRNSNFLIFTRDSLYGFFISAITHIDGNLKRSVTWYCRVIITHYYFIVNFSFFAERNRKKFIANEMIIHYVTTLLLNAYDKN